MFSTDFLPHFFYWFPHSSSLLSPIWRFYMSSFSPFSRLMFSKLFYKIISIMRKCEMCCAPCSAQNSFLIIIRPIFLLSYNEWMVRNKMNEQMKNMLNYSEKKSPFLKFSSAIFSYLLFEFRDERTKQKYFFSFFFDACSWGWQIS